MSASTHRLPGGALSDAGGVVSAVDSRLHRIGRHRLLMLLFISSESIFFMSLILAYVAFLPQTSPTAKTVLDVAGTAVFSVALLSSSITIMLAERGLYARRPGQLRLWLLVTIALGAIFLVGQALEYRHLISEGITINEGLFGTTFFTLTGFHGLHVLLGLLALAVIAVLTFAGDFDTGNEVPLGVVALYWHFVDGVWVAVFSVVYLWSLFLSS